jgi:hypothetical protein
MSKATTDAMDALHGALAKELLNRAESGEASSADLAVAAKFLKDNNVTAVIEDNAALAALRDTLARRRAKAPEAIPGFTKGPLSAGEKQDLLDNLH